MILEIVQPFRVILPDRVQHCLPGQVVEFPDVLAQRLLMKAGERVRAVTLGPGMQIWWNSRGQELGPATIAGTFVDSNSRLWAWWTFEGQERLVRASEITRVTGDGR